jgi:hypothetical protein
MAALPSAVIILSKEKPRAQWGRGISSLCAHNGLPIAIMRNAYSSVRAVRLSAAKEPADVPDWRPCYDSAAMLVRFRQTNAGLQCSLVETRRIDGAVRYEQVASLGLIPTSPSVSDRIAFWRRVYETLTELASTT